MADGNGSVADREDNKSLDAADAAGLSGSSGNSAMEGSSGPEKNQQLEAKRLLAPKIMSSAQRMPNPYENLEKQEKHSKKQLNKRPELKRNCWILTLGMKKIRTGTGLKGRG